MDLTSCAFLPSGKNILEESFIKDASTPVPEIKNHEFVSSGRPIYIEAIVYPQLIEGGHLSLGGKVGVYMGRESVALNQILDVQTGSLDKETAELK